MKKQCISHEWGTKKKTYPDWDMKLKRAREKKDAM